MFSRQLIRSEVLVTLSSRASVRTTGNMDDQRLQAMQMVECPFWKRGALRVKIAPTHHTAMVARAMRHMSCLDVEDHS